jgi:hypothetical protein
MPSTDMLYEIKENIAHIETLSKPLVKCEASDPERVPGLVGFRSGKRSALIKVDGNEYYRVKGCGNLTQGFNLQNMVYPPEQKEIRGVQFENTAFRELYFCKRIKEILEPHGFLVSDNYYNNSRLEMSRMASGNIPLRYQVPKMPAHSYPNTAGSIKLTETSV